jgi:hypothetical protein
MTDMFIYVRMYVYMYIYIYIYIYIFRARIPRRARKFFVVVMSRRTSDDFHTLCAEFP